MGDPYQIEMLWRCGACQNRNLGRHTQCQQCGKPKTGAEEYEMPSDTSEANAVQDASLLRVATAGANWRCRYCGSDQRRFDGACAQCGAAHAEGRDLGAEPAAPTPEMAVPFAPRSSIFLGGGGCALAVMGALVVLGFVAFLFTSRPSAPRVPQGPPFHDVSAAVASLAWEHAVAVERYHLVDREGFAADKPADAIEPHPAGQRVHHTDKVPDGFSTETYNETVPDGSRTETYTEQERCGESCTPRPKSCSKKCTPNKNGFATCEDVCTGGGQDCSPRYCSVSKSRQVPQTKIVTKTRQVPKFRDEPRYADWVTWKAWAWTPARVVKEHGETVETRWPAPEAVALGKGLGKGEQERERREARYEVHLRGDDGKAYEVRPATPDELQRFGAGTRHVVRVRRDGSLQEVDPATLDDAGPPVSTPAP